MLKVGTEEVYMPDLKTLVGIYDVEKKKMVWNWTPFIYKSAKGYYKNARGDVVQVKDDSASFIGVFTPETKSIIKGSEPLDLNTADLISELA
jgi:hypothetical protein